MGRLGEEHFWVYSSWYKWLSMCHLKAVRIEKGTGTNSSFCLQEDSNSPLFWTQSEVFSHLFQRYWCWKHALGHMQEAASVKTAWLEHSQWLWKGRGKLVCYSPTCSHLGAFCFLLGYIWGLCSQRLEKCWEAEAHNCWMCCYEFDDLRILFGKKITLELKRNKTGSILVKW